MAFLKHVGRQAHTGQRLVIVFMELPEEPDNALVIYSDALPDRYHQAIMEAVESPEGQSAKQFYEVMSRKVFWHGTPMLQTCHQEGLLKKVATKDIMMTPNSNTSIRLDDLNQQIRDGKKAQTKSLSESTEPVVEKSRVDQNVESSKSDENKQIAQNLLIQAKLLEQDAEAKRQEAYKYDPSLKPKAKSTSSIKTQAAKEEVSDTSETKPKRRGRPKKAETN